MIYPIAPPITVTQGFGANPAYYGPGGHNGLDLAAKVGTPVLAPFTGKVIEVGTNPNYVGGLFINIKDPSYTSYTGHMSRTDVSVGQQVTEGQVVGLSGATGVVSGPHVHWSLWLPGGKFIDPSTVVNEGEDVKPTDQQVDEWISYFHQEAYGSPASDEVFAQWRPVLKNNFLEGSLGILQGTDTNPGALKNQPKPGTKYTPYSGAQLYTEDK